MNLLHVLTARLRGFINSVKPRFGIKTVIILDLNGEIVKLESRTTKETSDDSTAIASRLMRRYSLRIPRCFLASDDLHGRQFYSMDCSTG